MPAPEGLSRSQFHQLQLAAEAMTETEVTDLLEQATAHSHAAREASVQSQLVNHRLAAAICDICHTVGADWDLVAESAQYWLKGAFRYFVSSDDDEHDFDSPIGFEDDAEVLNACLDYAGLPHLKISPEEYDDV